MEDDYMAWSEGFLFPYLKLQNDKPERDFLAYIAPKKYSHSFGFRRLLEPMEKSAQHIVYSKEIIQTVAKNDVPPVKDAQIGGLSWRW